MSAYFVPDVNERRILFIFALSSAIFARIARSSGKSLSCPSEVIMRFISPYTIEISGIERTRDASDLRFSSSSAFKTASVTFFTATQN